MLRTGGVALGTVGVAAGSATGQGVDYGGWFTDSTKGGAVGNYDGTTVDRTGQSEVTVQVGSQGNGGTFAFGPPAVRVDPGTTVRFTWVSNTHNIVVEEQPGGAGWGGHTPIENEGFEHTHTFETEGVYKYYCEPHLALGMKAAIVVGGTGGGAGGDGEAGGEVDPTLSLAFRVVGGGVLAVSLAALAVIGYVFARGEKYAPATTERVVSATEESSAFEPVRELDHDEFDPTGTASLIVAYFAILVLLWVFIYFVEFLGNGPTVIG